MFCRKQFCFILLWILCLSSCSKAGGETSGIHRYFIGLDSLRAGDKTAAIKAFTMSKAEDCPAAAGLAMQELLPLLYEQADYAAILNLTGTEAQIQPLAETNQNFLNRYRLLAMIGMKTPESLSYIADWVEKGNFSSQHIDFFADRLYADFASQEHLRYNPLFYKTDIYIRFYTALYKRNYGEALKIALAAGLLPAENSAQTEAAAVHFFENKTPQFLSACGNALLYGGSGTVYYASLLKQAADSYTGISEAAFLCSFYAARLYERAGILHQNAALAQFKDAVKKSSDSQSFDRALWYYLNISQKISSRSLISALQEFASQWRSPSYFDDILENLSHELLAAQNWQVYYNLYEFLLPYVSLDSRAKYAYISGRLIETGLLQNKNGTGAVQAFQASYDAFGGSLYYRLLAAERLDIPFEQVLASILQGLQKEERQTDVCIKNILFAYVQHDYKENVYPLFIKNAEKIKTGFAMDLSRALIQTAGQPKRNSLDSNFFEESLRIAVRAFFEREESLSRENFELLYPRFYSEFVTPVSTEYGLNEYVLYALIRSESFFNSKISSWAGAVGLTQLMGMTAADIGKKLKISNYDLLDAQTNIRFGGFYLQELIRRLNGSTLLALFSYNAGITKVRRWAAAYPKLSSDLLLEVLPYKETRDYGRKILSAAALYGCLYYNKSTHEIVREIMQ